MFLGFALADFSNPALIGLLFIGVGVGMVAALLGIGGGLLMVPTLVQWGATPLQASATSLVGIVLGSTSGTFQNWRMGQIRLERVALLAPPAMLTSELGVWLANKLPSDLLLLSFAALQIASIYLIGLKRKLKQVNSREVPVNSEMPRVATYPQTTVRLSKGRTKLPQPTVRHSSKLTDREVFRTQGIGLIAGVLSGLFGVGGGIVMVPLQMLFLGEDIKAAVRTSLGAIVLISVWAVGRHALSGNVLWAEGICLGIGGFAGAQLGARLLPKLPEGLVTLLFRLLLLSLATYMVVTAFWDRIVQYLNIA
ncbi:MAG: sulfite exporter TauE/SafE family protein [Leptolyngbyaceae cyanobacterium]